mgnify:CR=1 FL=1
MEAVASFCGLGRKPIRRMLLWNTMPLLIAAAIATTFYTVEHVDNNYANSSAPVGPPGSPQHYDCRERTSGIYPALFLTAMSLVLAPLSLAMDPQHSKIDCLRGKSAEENRWVKFSEPTAARASQRPRVVGRPVGGPADPPSPLVRGARAVVPVRRGYGCGAAPRLQLGPRLGVYFVV